MPKIGEGAQQPKKAASVEGRSSVSSSSVSSASATSSASSRSSVPSASSVAGPLASRVSGPSAASPDDDRARQVAESLSALYKELNKKWEALEKKLRELVPPRKVWFVYESQPDDELNPYAYHSACLGLVKYRGEWRICHGWYLEPHECEPDSWKPIVECSVEERVGAVEHADKLREKILAEAEKSISVVTEAVAKLASALEQ